MHASLIRQTVAKILPRPLFHGDVLDQAEREDLLEQLHHQLPLLVRRQSGQAPCTISFYLLYKYRLNSFKFFFEMISHWLIPGKRLNVTFFNAVDFRMPDLGSDQVYTLCELMVKVDSQEELEELQENLSTLETEICLGISSGYHARRILEIKGFSADEKTATIQEHVAHLLRRRPDSFDPSIFAEMQHVLVMCRDDFRTVRECRHISRIIGVQYLFRQSLRRLVGMEPDKRHLSLKIVKSRLHLPEGVKTVLGVIVGVNFLKDNEVLEERHILKAVQNYVPGVRAVEGAFLANQGRGEKVCTLYMEIEKSNGREFTSDELKCLRRALPSDLTDRIEHMMHPIFMPRNEEETMRNILALSNQLKYLRDIPQVSISFDEQTDSHISFSVILLRILKPGMPPVQELFGSRCSHLDYIHDRTRQVGFLRKKYVKEATVFHLKLPKGDFLRRDNSLDLNKARQVVVDELNRVLGEIRDFNGGMISKQNELLCAVRNSLGHELKHNEFMLENFFYSLAPVVMRTVLEPPLLKELFLLLLHALDDGFFGVGGQCLKTRCDERGAYAIVTAEQASVRGAISGELQKLGLEPLQLGMTFVNVYDTPRLGYVLRSSRQETQEAFLAAIEAGTRQG